MRLRVHLFFFLLLLLLIKKGGKAGDIYFLLFFLNSVCVWTGTPFLLVGSVQFSPDSRRLSTNQKRVKGKEPNGVARLKSLPLLHRVVVVGLLFAIGRRRHWRRLLRVQKREHANLVLSHPPVITHRESLGRLCALNVGGRGLPSKSFAIARILTSKHRHYDQSSSSS